MTSTRISHFPTRWFVNSISSSTTCFSDAEVISNPLHLKHHGRCLPKREYVMLVTQARQQSRYGMIQLQHI